MATREQLALFFSKKAFESGTSKRYQEQWSKFVMLCEQMQVNPLSNHSANMSVMMAIEHVVIQGMSIKTLSQWMSAVNSILQQNYLNKLVVDDYNYKCVITGLTKEFPTERRKATPFSMIHLTVLTQYVAQSPSEVTMKNLAILSFWGALRSQDVIKNPLTFGNVKFTESGVNIKLQKRKWFSQSVEIKCKAQTRYPCPRAAMLAQQNAMQPFASSNDCVFRKSSQDIGHTISVDVFMAFVNRVCGSYNTSNRPFTSHSFRSGNISWLISQGINRETVMQHSGHKSLAAFMGYIDLSAPDTCYAATDV